MTGSAEADEHCRRAQRNIPVLHTHDRFGNRVDRVEYDPSMHWMLRLRGGAAGPAVPRRPARHRLEELGNVIALDVLRAMRRNPEGVPALMAELEGAAGADAATTRTWKG